MWVKHVGQGDLMSSYKEAGAYLKREAPSMEKTRVE
jgi:hypothetical protein